MLSIHEQNEEGTNTGRAIWGDIEWKENEATRTWWMSSSNSLISIKSKVLCTS